MSASINNNSPKAIQQPQIDGKLPGNQKNASFIDKATDAYLDVGSKAGVIGLSLAVGGGALWAASDLIVENGKFSYDVAAGAFDHAMEGDLANAAVDGFVALGSTLPAIGLGVVAYKVGENFVQNQRARRAAAQSQSTVG